MTNAAPTMDEIASSTFDEVAVAAQKQYDTVLNSVVRNPLQAVGIAAGVGFVVARLLKGGKSAPPRVR